MWSFKFTANDESANVVLSSSESGRSGRLVVTLYESVAGLSGSQMRFLFWCPAVDCDELASFPRDCRCGQSGLPIVSGTTATPEDMLEAWVVWVTENSYEGIVRKNELVERLVVLGFFRDTHGAN